MISIENKAVLFNNIEIFEAPDKIEIVHTFDKKILLLYGTEGIIPHGPQINRNKPVVSNENLILANRNILMIDFQGNILWQIESDAKDHYNPWTVVGAHDGSQWVACTNDGYQYDLDIETGALSNGIFMK